VQDISNISRLKTATIGQVLINFITLTKAISPSTVPLYLLAI